MNKFLYLECINERLDVSDSTFFPKLIQIGNYAIENFDKCKENEDLIKKITNYIEREWKYLSEGVQIPIQIIAAQLKSVIVWRKLGLDIGRIARLSCSDKHLVISDKRSCNIFTESLNSRQFDIAKSEGEQGYFWRGFETLSKMKGNLVPDLFEIHGERSILNNQLLYCMNHGIIKCPNSLLESTKKKEISTLHDTYFSKSIIKESNQYLGTGHGHFQGFNLDVKQVISGIGFQIVVYFEKDNEHACGTSIKKIGKGDWILVPPGTKDYMVSIDNLRFMDFSIGQKNGCLLKLNPFIDNVKDIVKMLHTTADKFKICPKIILKSEKNPNEFDIVNKYHKDLKEIPLPTLNIKHDENIINLYGKLDTNPEKNILDLVDIE